MSFQKKTASVLRPSQTLNRARASATVKTSKEDGGFRNSGTKEVASFLQEPKCADEGAGNSDAVVRRETFVIGAGTPKELTKVKGPAVDQNVQPVSHVRDNGPKLKGPAVDQNVQPVNHVRDDSAKLKRPAVDQNVQPVNHVRDNGPKLKGTAVDLNVQPVSHVRDNNAKLKGPALDQSVQPVSHVRDNGPKPKANVIRKEQKLRPNKPKTPASIKGCKFLAMPIYNITKLYK